MKILCIEITCLLALIVPGMASNSNDRLWFTLGNDQASPDPGVFANAEKIIHEDKERTIDDLLLDRRHRKLQQVLEEEAGPSNDDIVTVECTETPIFMCEVPADCRGRVLAQQKHVAAEIQAQFPDAKIVSSTYKLVNALYVHLPQSSRKSGLLEAIDGVKRTMPHETHELALEDTVSHVGASAAQEEFCATGKGVTIAVLDSGVDYTHTMIGGTGIFRDYKRAYKRPRDRDGLFPTERVIEGYDFVGHQEGVLESDDDPIDDPGGHGTLVSSTILAVAPDAKLVAVRVCSRMCPEMAIIQGLEYALDPNQDDVMDDKVDIINMSLGTFFLAAYDSPESVAIENAFANGVLVVIAAGNFRNNPYIMGPIGSTPNGLAVGATGHPGNNPGTPETMEFYSSRGPGENNAIKPDISAPSGSSAALASTGTETRAVRGTSFSAPVVTGAAALLKERCPSCSPLALKALLMNNAFRNISYGVNMTGIAPVTIVGSGELRIRDSLDADFWAYSPDNGDVQPSLSLGLVNAASNITIRRTVRILNLSDRTEIFGISIAFRDPSDAASGAVSVTADEPGFILSGCNQEITVALDFHIDASKAPNNHMGVGGDPTAPEFLALDKNEFDGHVIIRSSTSGKEIALPFHLILRKAANTTLSTTSLPWQRGVASSTVVEVKNSGAGTAQLEAFDLLAISSDRTEGDRGEEPLGDIRSVGFRTLEVGEPGCTFVLEFLFNTWEKHDRLNTHTSIVALNVDGVEGFDYFVLNSLGQRNDIQVRKGSIRGDPICTGFPPDSSYNSRNTLLRVCSEDVGSPTQFDATFAVAIAPAELSASDVVTVASVPVNNSAFSAPSFNIGSGETLALTVSGSGTATGVNRPPLGLQLVTNGYRSAGNTGAATPETETHLLLVNQDAAFPELSPDKDKEFPSAQDTKGPECLWEEDACTFPTTNPTTSSAPTTSPAPSASPTESKSPTFSPEPTEGPTSSPTGAPSCMPNEVPRAVVASWAPSSSPTNALSAEPSVTSSPTTSVPPTNFPFLPPAVLPPPSSGPPVTPSMGPPSAATFACKTMAMFISFVVFTLILF